MVISQTIGKIGKSFVTDIKKSHYKQREIISFLPSNIQKSSINSDFFNGKYFIYDRFYTALILKVFSLHFLMV